MELKESVLKGKKAAGRRTGRKRGATLLQGQEEDEVRSGRMTGRGREGRIE